MKLVSILKAFSIVFSSAVFSSILSPSALALDFHGYLRSGMGSSRGGTDQVCFRAPGTEGASGKFRLGNECDTYIELALSHDVKESHQNANETKYRLHVRWSLVSSGHRDWESDEVKNAGDDSKVALQQSMITALREAYGEALHVLGGDSKAWIGKRFYRRHDLHMLDFYYVETAGPGAGLEDVDLGFGKGHLAVFRNVPEGSAGGPSQTTVDVRLTDIALWDGGTLNPILAYGVVGERDHKSGERIWSALNGWKFSLIYNQGVKYQNTLAVQYGLGLFGGDSEKRESAFNSLGAWGAQRIAKQDKDRKKAREKSSTLRVLDQLIWDVSPTWSMAFVFYYQHVDFGGATFGDTPEKDKTELTAGTRPILHITPNLDLAFEYGYTQVQNGIAIKNAQETAKTFKQAELYKFTVAPQLSMSGGFWARPQLRLFATYAMWNEDSKGYIGQDIYKDDTAGWSTGAQVEAWW